ncbi:MAG: hydrogenase iron-sulfur subunit [Desulfovibrionaceae bacterium]|nr:hydrogenase iron-sulfur subunit [Desulfovibrionaceae bacterium]
MASPKTYRPNIVAFFCRWCSYGAADLAGSLRLRYPVDIRIVRVPCSGSISPQYLLYALLQGADGVWVSGCHPGDCHYRIGNMHARRRLTLFHNLLDYVGIERARLLFTWIAASEAHKLQREAEAFVTAVAALGPARRLVKSLETCIL